MLKINPSIIHTLSCRLEKLQREMIQGDSYKLLKPTNNRAGAALGTPVNRVKVAAAYRCIPYDDLTVELQTSRPQVTSQSSSIS